jgi:hypothetical protein
MCTRLKTLDKAFGQRLRSQVKRSEELFNTVWQTIFRVMAFTISGHTQDVESLHQSFRICLRTGDTPFHLAAARSMCKQVLYMSREAATTTTVVPLCDAASPLVQEESLVPEESAESRVMSVKSGYMLFANEVRAGNAALGTCSGRNSKVSHAKMKEMWKSSPPAEKDHYNSIVALNLNRERIQREAQKLQQKVKNQQKRAHFLTLQDKPVETLETGASTCHIGPSAPLWFNNGESEFTLPMAANGKVSGNPIPCAPSHFAARCGFTQSTTLSPLLLVISFSAHSIDAFACPLSGTPG